MWLPDLQKNQIFILTRCLNCQRFEMLIFDQNDRFDLTGF